MSARPAAITGIGETTRYEHREHSKDMIYLTRITPPSKVRRATRGARESALDRSATTPCGAGALEWTCDPRCQTRQVGPFRRTPTDPVRLYKESPNPRQALDWEHNRL